MAPEPVIEYVTIHELIHLKEMNHSKRFWELVAQYCPGWREHKKWLKQHETDLTSKLCALK
jgi:predicted metal-dependent hydrolase